MLVPIEAVFALTSLISISTAFGYLLKSLLDDARKDRREAYSVPDDTLLMEIERQRQMLEMAARDVSELDGSDPSEYLHDLSCRDYFTERYGDGGEDGDESWRMET